MRTKLPCGAFQADVYRFPALADVTAALVAGFTLDHTGERGRGPMLLLATKSANTAELPV
ncbi:hypothetical protein MEA186_07459 [Mesorhizobium amorphae CCNWGS0123]|uniref:Uncharacterized protein n=1 Tax=Mesorhizobium amorphae CCNWGS0123 TaxID=1082933 RepID=G6Y6C7_9HYPH|nr:hypothetical protein A6B35_08790 [Mesorhizobium amorphae CCNWGS0123]EHH12617.1 hypothetical protein MEA186_07459 [Mesorhizobium amorphae CCNWGS0123]